MSKLKRLNYLINHRFQLRLILYFVVGVIVAFLLYTGGFIAVGWAMNNLGEGRFTEIFELSTRVETGEPMVDPVTGEAVVDPVTGEIQPKVIQRRTVLWRWEIVTPAILINNLLILVIVSVAGIFFTHRIAGPLFNINRSLHKALHGNLHHPILLRKKDFFHDTAGLLNQALKKGHLITPPPERHEG